MHSSASGLMRKMLRIVAYFFAGWGLYKLAAFLLMRWVDANPMGSMPDLFFMLFSYLFMLPGHLYWIFNPSEVNPYEMQHGYRSSLQFTYSINAVFWGLVWVGMGLLIERWRSRKTDWRSRET